MPSICGYTIRLCVCRSRRSSSSKSSEKPIIHNVNIWKPPRPSRDDGLFGVPKELPLPPPKEPPAPEISTAPAQLYPPVRSPLRHKSERLPRGKNPVNLGRSMSVGGYFDSSDDYPEDAAPAPLRPKQRSNSVETASIVLCDRPSGANIAPRICRSTEVPAQNDVAPQQPRYGPNSRPPVTRSRENLKHSSSTAKRRNKGEASVRITPVDFGRPSRLEMQDETYDFPMPLSFNRVSPKSPQAHTHHSTMPSGDFCREQLDDNQPLYFMPVFNTSPTRTPAPTDGGFI